MKKYHDHSSFENMFLIKGSVEHEILGFFRREAVHAGNQQRKFTAIFYDCNPGTNALGIARLFMKGMNVNCLGIYSDALHGQFNRAERDLYGGRK